MTPFHAGSWDLQQFNVYEVPGTFTGSYRKGSQILVNNEYRWMRHGSYNSAKFL
jgi:hypothetical protein